MIGVITYKRLWFPLLREEYLWHQTYDTADLHKQMGSSTSLIPSVRRGVCGTISVSDHEYSCCVSSPRQCDESWGQSSIGHMWLNVDQIIFLALIYHWIFLGRWLQGCGCDAWSFYIPSEHRMCNEKFQRLSFHTNFHY